MNYELADVHAQFMQDADTSDSESAGNTQLIEFEAVYVPNGGHFYRISTERWAFEDEAELVALFRKFKAMLKQGAK